MSVVLTPTTVKLTATNNLGGPFQGYSPQQTKVMYKNSEDAMARKILRSAWNNNYVGNSYNNKNRIITPFRAVNNLGDFLGRQNYNCGGPNQVNVTYPGRMSNPRKAISSCDGSGVPSSSCNPRFVPDSSDYIRFKKQTAMNKNYNDLKNGGDANHASYVPLMAVRRR
jgi:hypothetical protein